MRGALSQVRGHKAETGSVVVLNGDKKGSERPTLCVSFFPAQGFQVAAEFCVISFWLRREPRLRNDPTIPVDVVAFGLGHDREFAVLPAAVSGTNWRAAPSCTPVHPAANLPRNRITPARPARTGSS